MKSRIAILVLVAAFVVVPAPAAWAQPTLGFQVGSLTQVNIMGLLAVGLKGSQVTNTNRPGLNTETRLDDNTSRLIISSSSKIADGWAVNFVLESRFFADSRPGDPFVPGTTIYNTNYGWADGDTYGAISSPFGSMSFGHTTLYYTDTINVDYLGLAASPGEGYRIWDVNGLGSFNMLDQVTSLTKTGVGAGSLFTFGNGRARNVVRYNSPNFSGLTFSLAWTPNAASNELQYIAPDTPGYTRSYTNGATLYGTARYNKGPVSAQLSYYQSRVAGGAYNPAAQAGPTDNSGVRAGASYKLPFNLKIGVVWDRTQYDNSVYASAASAVATEAAKRDVFLIPVSYSWKDHAFYVTYSIAGNTSSVANTGATQLNIGYDYALTKRAFAGLYYTSIKNDSYGHYTPFLAGSSIGPTANSVAGENWWQFGANLNYWF